MLSSSPGFLRWHNLDGDGHGLRGATHKPCGKGLVLHLLPDKEFLEAMNSDG